MLEQAERRRIHLSTRSQLATELLLTCFALVASIVVLRTVLVMLDVTDRIWIGSFIFGLTRPVTNVLDFLPGSDRHILGSLTTVDLTLLGSVFLFLLGVLATGRQND